VDDFVAYAKAAFKEFGPYVKTWLTFNEPKNGCFLGWSTGVFAPFLKDPAAKTPEGSATGWKCMHNMVAAHAGAAKAYAGLKAPVGGGIVSAALDTEWTIPLDPDNPKDVEAAQRYIDYRLGIFADPLWKGDWPASVRARIPPSVLPPISESLRKDLLAHKSPTFFINHYSTKVVKDAPGYTGGYGEGLTDYGEQYEFANGTKVGPVADSSWLYVYPGGLRSLLNYVYKTYKPKSVVVSESGVDVPDEAKMGRDEVLADSFRVNYYKGYVQSAADAKNKDGVPVDLYLAWSLTDGVEWAEKMTKLFGIVWTDYEKGGQRVPKDSAYWLAETFRTLNGTAPAAGGEKPAASGDKPKPAAEPAAAAKPAAADQPAKAGEPASI
jgi:beta-glucosidase